MKCLLCQEKGATLFSNIKEYGAIYLCEGCTNDVKKLFSLSVGDDLTAYNKYKQDFLEDFNESEGAKKIVDIINKTGRSPDFVKTIHSKMFDTATQAQSFLPFKLFFATLIALFSILFPCFGILGAFIARIMAFEIPDDYSPIDVNRARRLSKVAFWVNLIEIVIAIIVSIIIACS